LKVDKSKKFFSLKNRKYFPLKKIFNLMVPNILKKKLQHSTFFIYIFISNNNIRNEKYNAYNTRTEEEYLK